MKKKITLRLLLALLVAVATPAALASTFSGTIFLDNFTGASTINSASPAGPTATSTSYECASTKYWTNPPSISSHDLRLNAPDQGGNILEAQALFYNNAVSLQTSGDFIRLTITFVDTSNLCVAGLNSSCFLGFGLYNSSQILPYPGGGMESNLLNTGVTYLGPGYAQIWQGYTAQISTPTFNSRLMTRTNEIAVTDNRNQDLVTSASTGSSYPLPSTLSGSTITTGVILTNMQTYTEVLTISYIGVGGVAITNSLYGGAGTNGTLLQTLGGIASTTNSQYQTAGYDAFAFGFYQKSSTAGQNILDVSSIQVDCQATITVVPPHIDAQPASVAVATNGGCAYWVSASGISLNYQWYLNGTPLNDDTNISGSHSYQLSISSAGPANQASAANGYYCNIYNTAGATNSVTNSLTLIPATNLVWASTGGGAWDLTTTTSWKDTSGNPAMFNYGDAVTFNDTGSPYKTVNLNGAYLSAASVTVTSAVAYTFQGSGSFTGPGKLNYIGTGELTINNANTYSGGTLISNANISAPLYLNNLNGLGVGPVTLARGAMEIPIVGSAGLGIRGDIIVAGNFTNQFDAGGNFSGVFFGNLSGTVGKTLTLTPDIADNGATTNRFRVYGTNTVYDANLVIVGNGTTNENYQGSCLAPYNPIGSQTYNGTISGSGGLIQRDNGMTILKGANTYAGGTTPSAGSIAFGINSATNGSGTVISGPIGTGPLYVVPELPNVTASGQVLAWGGARTIANPIVYPSATNNLTLIIGGTNALTFTSPIALNGQDGIGTNNVRIFQVTNTAVTTFSGVISDGGGAFGLFQSGSGILALNNAETYTGPTTISNGTLWVNGSLNAASAVTVSSNGVLAGTGTVNGSVTINPYGAIAPGTNVIGTNYIGGNLSLAGNVKVRVNHAGLASDKAIVTGTLVNTGTGDVIVTSTGAALQVSDTFHIFNKAVTGGATMFVGGAGVSWINHLALDGTIVVGNVGLPHISTTVSGSTLTLSWPATYPGYTVQSNIVGLASSTNWYTVTNPGSSTSYAVTLSSAKTNVFYRLVFP